MRIEIRAIGRMKAGAERDLVARYGERIGKTGRRIGLSGFQIREYNESRAGDAVARRRDEAAQLLSGVDPAAYVMALDERGKSPDSRQFAKLLGGLADAGRATCVIVIGGADGLDACVRERADRTVSFGAMTWPHQIVRILAAEQLYRAITILSGHPYHRE